MTYYDSCDSAILRIRRNLCFYDQTNEFKLKVILIVKFSS